MTESRKKLWIGLLLGLGTCILYWPVIYHGFVNFDDLRYISDNRQIQSGLTLPSLEWAFRSGYASNWHPITWISHMLDYQLYGLNPAGHHLTNLIFHSLNSVLLFVLLNQMTEAIWRSGFAAGLFAWHPLHVESVAWAAERKDLLCGFFWILTMLAYVQYVKASKCAGRPNVRKWYGTSILLFALALMSKPMAVTLPFVLLLVDLWPLRRITVDNSGVSRKASMWASKTLLVEKVPFFVLAIASCIITTRVQRGAAASLQGVPVFFRLENAVVAYVSYVAKTFWPAHLAVIYPLPHHIPMGSVYAATLLLVLVSCLFLKMVGQRPYLAAGWFWFLGTLVPAIGLIQVGPQAMADRYTYLPGIGLFIIFSWGAVDLLARWSLGPKICGTLGPVLLGACIIGTRHQLDYWQNSVTLFSHTVAITTNNYFAYSALGTGFESLGKTNEALQMYEKSVSINPRYAAGQNNLGSLLLTMGRTEEAIQHLQAALKARPGFASAEDNLSVALLAEGKTAEAEIHLRRALELFPDDPQAHYNLGKLLLMNSNFAAAVDEFSLVVRLTPGNAQAHGNAAVALVKLGRSQEALAQFSEAVRLDPADEGARLNFGEELITQNKPVEAQAQFSEALRLQPNDAAAHCGLAKALARQGKVQGAIFHYQEALRLAPDLKEVQDELNLLSGATH